MPDVHNANEALDQGRASAPYGPIYFVDPVRRVADLSGSAGFHGEIPLMGDVGPYGDGTFSTPTPGWCGTVSGRTGARAVDGYLSGPVFPRGRPELDDDSGALDTWLTLTGTPKLYRTLSGSTTQSYRSSRATDLIAGDQGFRSAEGAMIGALRGGVAVVKASDLCQAIFNQVDDTARLLGRNLEFLTDWGSVQFENRNGTTGLTMRGSRQSRKTYADKFDFECRVGGEPGLPFLSIKLYDEQGATIRDGRISGKVVVSLQCDQQGGLSMNLAGDHGVFVGGEESAFVTGVRHTELGNDDELVVDGKQDIRIAGQHAMAAQDSIEQLKERKLILAPQVVLGKVGGEAAPMGETLLTYLKRLVDFINGEMIITHPFLGPNLPGCRNTGLPAPAPPADLLSDVVSYPREA